MRGALEIRRLERYTIPKYPRGGFEEPAPALPPSLGRRAAVSLALVALIEACDTGSGVTGPPPVRPDFVTESEARRIIDTAFEDNGVSLEHDIRFVLGRSPSDSVELTLDGYNDSLGVGYEYVSEPDYATFTFAVRNSLDSLASEHGPYVKPICPAYLSPGYSAYLRSVVQEFVDTLKAHGVI